MCSLLAFPLFILVFDYFNLVDIYIKFSHSWNSTGGEVVNLEWTAEGPVQEAAGGLNMIGVIWLKRKS